MFTKKFVDIHVALADYKMQLMQEHYTLGRPFTRAMMLEYPDLMEVRNVIDQFMLGPNILVAPVFGT